ncbi:MAG: insulinase family protein, partial [Sphingomonadales bacterium]|nr:insulinase family protein [Sphingomonadales bacterium]
WGEPRGFKEKKPIPTVALPAKARVVIMDKPGAEQSLILAGHLVPGGMSDDNYVMAAMNEILGGSFTARVNMNLREDKHWAYGAYTFMRGARGQQPWMAYAPVQTDKTMESIAELVKEFDAYLGNKPATEAELDKVVKNTVRSLPGQFETAGSVLGSMVGAANYGRPLDYATTIKERYEGLTLETIHAKAQSTLKPKQLTWLVIGDRSKIEEGIRSLNLGDLEVWDKDGNKISE